MRYLKIPWDETRGDEFDAWGTSVWLFEVDDNGYPLRQVEVYSSGTVLIYDRVHLQDRFGGLGDQPVEVVDIARYEITASDFEVTWSTVRSLNR